MPPGLAVTPSRQQQPLESRALLAIFSSQLASGRRRCVRVYVLMCVPGQEHRPVGFQDAQLSMQCRTEEPKTQAQINRWNPRGVVQACQRRRRWIFLFNIILLLSRRNVFGHEQITVHKVVIKQKKKAVVPPFSRFSLRIVFTCFMTNAIAIQATVGLQGCLRLTTPNFVANITQILEGVETPTIACRTRHDKLFAANYRKSSQTHRKQGLYLYLLQTFHVPLHPPSALSCYFVSQVGGARIARSKKH